MKLLFLEQTYGDQLKGTGFSPYIQSRRGNGLQPPRESSELLRNPSAAKAVHSGWLSMYGLKPVPFIKGSIALRGNH
jgi:hypothetical protein